MVEISQIGQVVHADPLDRRIGLNSFVNLLDFWRLLLDYAVAVHTNVGCRNCSRFTFVNTRVTVITVNLILTFRKFLSLLISIFYFHKLFTFGHVFGSLLVFGGTIVYSGILPSQQNMKNEEDELAPQPARNEPSVIEDSDFGTQFESPLQVRQRKGTKKSLGRRKKKQ